MTMKKYWKIILISLVIVTAISFYYIQLAMASKNDVSFKIETISGNKEEMDRIALDATYNSEGNGSWLNISKDGSFEQQSQSFIRDLIGDDVPLMFEKYIQEHRNFMRGKRLDPSTYFEDEARLIYADFPYYYGQESQRNSLILQIDILDKQTNDSTTFEINTPVYVGYSGMDVLDVYSENGKIKILAIGYLRDDGEKMHVYTIDESKKELEDDSIIVQSDPDMSNFRIFNGFNIIQNESYYLYEARKYGKQKEDAEPELISSQMYLYNNSTSEVEKLDIPTELKPFMDSIAIQGVEIYIPVQSANGIELNRYHIEKKQWEEPSNFNYPSSTNEDDSFLQITDGKLYFVNRVSDGHSFFIGDLRTEETLYEGKIIRENKENLDKDYSLYIHQLDIIN